uniref:Matrilysin-like n=1 Tax=Diabrotica virgifera virgifera TaxID=50390 RepID=A0A6P7FCS0_DIAVI
MLVCLHVLLLLSVSVCAENSTLESASSFLKRFGYLNTSSNAISSIDMVLVEFQERYNLPVTGKLNNDTMNMIMNKPRCSVGDNNYAIHSKWNKTTLSWYFPQAVSNPVYIHLAEDAFVRWEKISNLKFKRVIIPSSKPDITITVVPNYIHRAEDAFVRRGKISNLKFKRVIIPSSKPDITITVVPNNHNFRIPSSKPDITITVVSNNHSFRASCQGTSKCPFNFDGPGKVLAHAYYPGVNDCIEIHLDANERWYAGNGRAPDGEANFLAVLEHSNSDLAILYPWYQQDVISFGDDDKKAMSMLYGQTEAPTSMSTAPVTQTTLSKNRIYLPTTPAIKNICLLQYPDFMFLATSPQFPNYRMYVGSDKYLWKFDLNEMRLPVE